MRSYPHLASPFTIGGLTIRNRLCLAPLTSRHHIQPDGSVSRDGVAFLVARASGGFGLLFTGALTADDTVDPNTGFGPSILRAPLQFRATAGELTERVHAFGAVIFAQITMGFGRNHPDLPAPSAIPVLHSPYVVTPVLTREQIHAKISAVVSAARLARGSGFDGVEIHAMHWGNLLDLFALSFMNRRTDEYGGALENRLRAAREIIEGIRQECGPDFPVSMRLSLKSYLRDFEQASLTGEEEKGRTLEEGIAIAKHLESYGYVSLSVDAGSADSLYYACPPMYVPKGFMVELAGAIRSKVGIPVLASGRMNDADIAEKAVAAGKMDGVLLGRAALADPDYANKILSGNPEHVRPCLACNQGCISRLLQGKHPSCAVNPCAMREDRFALRPVFRKKDVVVAGGGVAGMEAARVLALRGHAVRLFEKSRLVGGSLLTGGVHAFKKEVRELNAWYERELQRLPVSIYKERNVGATELRALKADVIILATGALPVMPDLPGMEDEKVLGCEEALRHPERIGQRVAVVGGGLVGCEIALSIAGAGRSVTVVEALPRILSSGLHPPVPNGQMLADLFDHYGITVLESHRMVGVRRGRLVLTCLGLEKKLDVDTIVIAVGFRPRPSLLQELAGCGSEVYQVGDARKAGSVMQAVWTAYEVANSI